MTVLGSITQNAPNEGGTCKEGRIFVMLRHDHALQNRARSAQQDQLDAKQNARRSGGRVSSLQTSIYNNNNEQQHQQQT
jgi:hypothetical protein